MTLTKHLQPVAFLDPPKVFDAAAQNIPASSSSPTQVIAKLAKTCHAIDFYDAIGKFVGVYVGPPGSEVFRGCIGGGGKGRLEISIPQNSRVCFRNEENAVINTGKIWVHFLG
jgi:hypothetical protein